MSHQRRDADMDRIERRAGTAARIIPSVLDGLAERLAAVGDRTGNETGITTGDPTDPTGDLAAARSHIINHTRRIRDSKLRVKLAMDDLDRTCRDALGRQPSPGTDEPTCHGGDPSTWGDASCDELVEMSHRPGDASVRYDPDGLCIDHRIAKERHERLAAKAAAERQRRHDPTR